MNDHAVRFGPGLATLALHAGDQGGDPATLLEERIAMLEGGTAAVSTPSGVTALLVLHALLERGTDVALCGSLAGEAAIDRLAADFGWRLVRTEPVGLAGSITAETRAILVESMGPSGEIVDLEAIASMAADAGIPLIVDNTRASPSLVRPVEHGASVVIHEDTTRLAGPGAPSIGIAVDAGTFDWVAGGGKLGRPDGSGRSAADRFGNFALAAAVLASPLCGVRLPSATADAVLQGLATLPLRARRQSDSAMTVASRLAGHAALRRVSYAGMADPAGMALVRRYRANGAGPIVTLDLADGLDRQAVVDRLQLFGRPARAGAAASALLDRPDAPASLVLSVGLEDAEDLIADLDQALSPHPQPIG